jgi:hypothetical protein
MNRDSDRDYSEEAVPEYLAFSETLACGHTVEASEDSGGFDEVPRVTEKMVRDLLAFKVRVHNCELADARFLRVAAARLADDADGGPF